jgi:hypothetical protein
MHFKKLFYVTSQIYVFVFIALSIGNSLVFISGGNHNFLHPNSERTSISYGYYIILSNDAYTYNVIEWRFNTSNQSKIVVLKMDYENYQKFYINDSNAEYQTLSEGKTKDNGVASVPYDDEWIILFFNTDSSRSWTVVELDVNILLNPVFYIILPFILISIYYKRQKKENKLNCYFWMFIIFLSYYIYLSWSLIPLIQQLR